MTESTNWLRAQTSLAIFRLMKSPKWKHGRRKDRKSSSSCKPTAFAICFQASRGRNIGHLSPSYKTNVASQNKFNHFQLFSRISRIFQESRGDHIGHHLLYITVQCGRLQECQCSQESRCDNISQFLQEFPIFSRI